MAKERRQNFVTGAAILAAAVAVTKVIGALYKIPLGNLLDKEGMAHFYVAYNIYNLLVILSTAGLPLALSRLVSQAHALGRVNQRRRVFRVALVLFFAIGAVCSGVMLLFPRQLAVLLHDSKAAPAILALSPSVLCVCLIAAIRGYTQGQGNMKPTAASQIIESLCKLLVGLSLAWLLLGRNFGSDIAAAGAIAGVSVGSLISLLVLAVYLLRYRSGKAGSDLPQGRREIAGELLRIGVPITVGAGGMSCITLLDQVLVMGTLQGKLGLSEAAATALYGEYTFGMTLFNLPSSFIYPVTVSLIPVIGAALARNDRLGACRSTESAFRLTALLAFPAGVGLSVLAGPILDLLYPAVPETAAAAAYHLSVLGIACIFVCLMVLTNGVLQAYGKEYIPVISLLLGGGLKIAANAALVGRADIGIKGAPVGTLCCYVLITVLNLIAIHRCIPQRPDYFRIFIRPLTATALMAVAATGCHSFLTRVLDGSGIAVLLAIAAAVLVYAVAAVLLGAVTRQDLLALPKGEKIADFLRIP